jgi:hypothetical protein
VRLDRQTHPPASAVALHAAPTPRPVQAQPSSPCTTCRHPPSTLPFRLRCALAAAARAWPVWFPPGPSAGGAPASPGGYSCSLSSPRLAPGFRVCMQVCLTQPLVSAEGNPCNHAGARSTGGGQDAPATPEEGCLAGLGPAPLLGCLSTRKSFCTKTGDSVRGRLAELHPGAQRHSPSSLSAGGRRDSPAASPVPSSGFTRPSFTSQCRSQTPVCMLVRWSYRVGGGLLGGGRNRPKNELYTGCEQNKRV